MFKKPFKVSSKNQLSGKDKKDLKLQMLGSLSAPSVEAFFASNSKLISEKVTQLKISIFVNEEEDPIFIHFIKDNHYLPTLYIVSQYPDLLQSIILKEGVEQFVFKGANIMCPGVDQFPKLDQGRMVAVRNSKGIPVAVGYMGINAEQGIACTVVHYMGDKLWEHGSKILSPVKFQEEKQKNQEKQQEKVSQVQPSNTEVKTETEQNKGASESQDEDDESKQLKDKNLESAFFNVLKLQKFSKQDFPILTTTFFSKYVKVASPIPLDVSHSTYKRVSTFFEIMAEKGFIELQKTKDKSGNVWAITSVNRNTPEIKQHNPTIEDLPKQKQQFVLEKFKLVCNIKLQVVYKLTPILEFLRVFSKFPEDTTKVFEERQLDYLITRFLAQNKIKKYTKLVETKIKGKNVKVKKQFIDIEYQNYPYLKEIIQKEISFHLNNFKLEQELNQTVEQTVLKNVIPISLEGFNRNIYRLAVKSENIIDERTGAVEVLNTKKPFASILLQAFKSHNKNVTTINNLEPFLCSEWKEYDQLQELAHYLQLKYACGSSVRQSAEGKSQIYLQGNMFDAVMDFLINEQGVDPSLINGINKLPKKKK